MDVLTDDEYRVLQHFLVQYPDAYDVIPGSSGLRKLRWTISGKGKRGGTRVIYYWLKPRDLIVMLFVFKKHERRDLGEDQIKTRRSIAAKELQ